MRKIRSSMSLRPTFNFKRKDNMSELVIKTARENEDLPKKGYPTPPYKSKKLFIKKCSCCYHPPTKEYPKKFVKDNPDLFPEFNTKKE